MDKANGRRVGGPTADLVEVRLLLWSRALRGSEVNRSIRSAGRKRVGLAPAVPIDRQLFYLITSLRLTPMRSLMRWSSGTLVLAVDHPALDLRSATHGVHNTRELRQEAVVGALHNPAMVLLYLRLNELREMGFEALVRPLLVQRPSDASSPSHRCRFGARAMMDRQGYVGSSSDSLLEETGFEPSVPRDTDDGFRSNSPARHLPERGPRSEPI
jgi:hypothetical protein